MEPPFLQKTIAQVPRWLCHGTRDVVPWYRAPGRGGAPDFRRWCAASVSRALPAEEPDHDPFLFSVSDERANASALSASLRQPARLVLCDRTDRAKFSPR